MRVSGRRPCGCLHEKRALSFGGLLMVRWLHSAAWGSEGPCVKLGVQTEMSGPKSCEALASTCRLHRSLAGCLEFWRSRVEPRRSLRRRERVKEK